MRNSIVIKIRIISHIWQNSTCRPKITQENHIIKEFLTHQFHRPPYFAYMPHVFVIFIQQTCDFQLFACKLFNMATAENVINFSISVELWIQGVCVLLIFSLGYCHKCDIRININISRVWAAFKYLRKYMQIKESETRAMYVSIFLNHMPRPPNIHSLHRWLGLCK